MTKNVITLGQPGGSAFPFEITAPTLDDDQTIIVYALNTVDAANIFSVETTGLSPLFNIRLMSDNE